MLAQRTLDEQFLNTKESVDQLVLFGITQQSSVDFVHQLLEGNQVLQKELHLLIPCYFSQLQTVFDLRGTFCALVVQRGTKGKGFSERLQVLLFKKQTVIRREDFSKGFLKIIQHERVV